VISVTVEPDALAELIRLLEADGRKDAIFRIIEVQSTCP